MDGTGGSPATTVVPFDEMLLPDGSPRATHAAMFETLSSLGADGLSERARQRDAYLDRHGITFTLGERERPLPMDLVPRLLTPPEWKHIEAGVIQRLRALEAFLSDVYGAGNALKDGLIPRRLVTTSTHFHRQAWGIETPNNVRIHVSGIDLIRDEAGDFRVLEDNLRNPSGVSYVLENRRTLAHVLPEIFTHHRVRSVNEYPERLLDALKAAAPPDIKDPTVVVLTPGVHNSAHYEHAFLARHMGVELVEGRDLYCRDYTVWMRTTSGPEPVHVIYRRIDDDFLDPVHLLPGQRPRDSRGRERRARGPRHHRQRDRQRRRRRQGGLSLRARLHPLLPRRRADPAQRRHVRPVRPGPARVGARPARPHGGQAQRRLRRIRPDDGPVGDRRAARSDPRAVLDNPRGWIAQPVVTFSTCPTVVEDGRISPRHVDLRPFAVNDGTNVFVLPGGLSRVALPEGSLVVNSSQGGGSKDTWVIDDGTLDDAPPESVSPGAGRTVALGRRGGQLLQALQLPDQPRGPDRPAATPAAAGRRRGGVVLSRIAESFFWLGRYVERAEATARLLAEHHQLLVEDRSVPEELGCALLLDALTMPSAGVDDGARPGARGVGSELESSTITGRRVGGPRQRAGRAGLPVAGHLRGPQLRAPRAVPRHGVHRQPGHRPASRPRAPARRQRRRRLDDAA